MSNVVCLNLYFVVSKRCIITGSFAQALLIVKVLNLYLICSVSVRVLYERVVTAACQDILEPNFTVIPVCASNFLR